MQIYKPAIPLCLNTSKTIASKILLNMIRTIRRLAIAKCPEGPPDRASVCAGVELNRFAVEKTINMQDFIHTSRL